MITAWNQLRQSNRRQVVTGHVESTGIRWLGSIEQDAQILGIGLDDPSARKESVGEHS
jgi:hypothetical protein